MKRVIASASLLVFGAAGAASVAQAQDTSGQDNPGVTGNPAKPWSITYTLRGFYDSNPNTAPDNTPGKIDSWGIENEPAASLMYDWGASKLSASALYDNRYYFARRNTDQTIDLEAAFDHNISERYSFSVSDSFVIAQEPQVIAGSGALATPIRDEGNNVRNTASIDFRAQLTPLFGLVLGYANTLYDYDESFANSEYPNNPSYSALLNRDENNVTIDTTWQLAPETTGIFGYTFGAVVYTSSESVLNDPNPLPDGTGYPFSGPFYLNPNTRNNYSHTFYAGLDHTFMPTLSGSLRVGVQYIDYYNDVQLIAPGNFPKQSESSWSPYADISLNYAYIDGGMLKFGFRHAHNQTDQAANTANLGAGLTEDEESSVVYLDVNQQLTPISPQLSGSLTAEYQNSDFNYGPVNGETDNYYLFGIDLKYQFNRFLSADAGFNYDLIASDIPNRGYNRSQIFLGVDAAY